MLISITAYILKDLKIDKYFDFVLAAYEVSCAKPDVKLVCYIINIFSEYYIILTSLL